MPVPHSHAPDSLAHDRTTDRARPRGPERTGPRSLRVLFALLAMLGAVAVIGTACTDDKSSDDTSKDDDANTAKDADQSTETSDSSSDSSDAGSDSGSSADFTAAVEAANKSLDAATDACGVVEATNELVSVGDPSTTDEVKAAVQWYVAFLNKAADTSSDAATADQLRTSAKAFQDYAESVDYDPDTMDLGGDGPDYPEAAATEAALNQWYETEYAACAPDTTDSGTTDTTS